MRHLTIGLVGLAAVMFWQCGDDDEGDAVCGNNKVEVGEQCDREAAANFSCGDIGMGQGTVLCTDECRWDFSGCTVSPLCGDGVRDPGEACDGSAIGDLECADLGYDAGTLGCENNCFFDVTGCCRDGCDTAGETRCDGDVVETCGLRADGCLDWGDAVDCAAQMPVQVCDATNLGFGCVAPPCTDECALEGATQCDATMIQTCATGAEGCLGWVDSVDCSANLPPQGCDDSGGSAACVVGCTDACPTVGAVRCAFGDSVIQTCEVQPSGCRDWSLTEDCGLISSTAFCDDGGSTPVCQPCAQDCASAGDLDCWGEFLLRSCVEVVTGCFEMQVIEDCSQTVTCGVCATWSGTPDCAGGC